MERGAPARARRQPRQLRECQKVQRPGPASAAAKSGAPPVAPAPSGDAGAAVAEGGTLADRPLQAL